MREASPAFQARSPTPLMKWNLKTMDEAFLPVTLNCWPTSTSDGTQIVLELELTDTNLTLEDVHVRFSAPSQCKPNILSAEPGEASFDVGAQQVHWYIPVLDKRESTGTLEFSASTDA